MIPTCTEQPPAHWPPLPGEEWRNRKGERCVARTDGKLFHIGETPGVYWLDPDAVWAYEGPLVLLDLNGEPLDGRPAAVAG